MHDAFMEEAFRGEKINNLQGSFLSNHFAKHGTYCQKLSEASICARKICLVRDPSQRLYSNIKHAGAREYNKSGLINKCMKHLPNLMDRYIYDYNLFENHKEFPYCSPTDYENCDSIDFLDISDDQFISMVKSSFLSATLMPNIVQYNRLNDERDKEINKRSLTERDFQDIHGLQKQCLQKRRYDIEITMSHCHIVAEEE